MEAGLAAASNSSTSTHPLIEVQPNLAGPVAEHKAKGFADFDQTLVHGFLRLQISLRHRTPQDQSKWMIHQFCWMGVRVKRVRSLQLRKEGEGGRWYESWFVPME